MAVISYLSCELTNFYSEELKRHESNGRWTCLQAQGTLGYTNGLR
jgi:hypothetical protein